MAKRILIMGAGGKDFHIFNVLFKDKPEFNVVAFTATQIPGIDKRIFPAQIAGKLYPNGIPIFPESELSAIIKRENVERVVFAYSDVSYEYLKKCESIVSEAGAKFSTPAPLETMIEGKKPVVSVCAVRTGAGKSPISRYVVKILRQKGKRVVVVRHPMPYGDLAHQEVQRFETISDMKRHRCTIEEQEEYEPHIRNGAVVFAGVDYAKILAEAQSEADIIVWDGGNNDTPFFKPKLHIVVTDPLRPGHEVSYYPGFENLRLANIVVITKIDQAKSQDIATVERNIGKHNPGAAIVRARLKYSVSNPALIQGRRVLAVEDGPTLTHGEMKFGVGVVAAKKLGAKELVDPRPFLVGTIKETFQKYPDIGALLPAVGYSPQQIADLEETINASDAETVIIATPADLTRIIKINKPTVRVEYEVEEVGQPTLETILPARLGII